MATRVAADVMTYLRPVVLVRGSLESNLDFEGNLDRLLRVVEQCSSLHDVLAHPLLTCWQRHPTGRNQGARGCAMDGEAEDADMRLEEAVQLAPHASSLVNPVPIVPCLAIPCNVCSWLVSGVLVAL